MSQDTNVQNLIINKLTKQQYESISNPDPTQLYFVIDEGTTIATLDDVSISNLSNGQILQYDSTSGKWENTSAPASAVWGNITGTLSNQTDLNTALNGKQETLVSGTNIKTINGSSILGSGDIQLATSVDIDDLTITKNTNDELQTVATIDSNDSTKAIKIWTGTQAQYDAIATKDPNTLYNIKEDGSILKEYPARVVGQIIQSTIPLTDAGLHLLDGTLLNGSGIYSDFVTYIGTISSSYPNLFVTEADWQQSVTDYGVCGKFVYDSTNNTVRLPKIVGFVEGAGGISALGDLTEAGLPNITGNTCLSITDAAATGAFMSGSSGDIGAGASKTYSGYGVNFDASRSSSIYGNSSTVQPQSVKVLYYIVVATSAKTDIQVDIDEIATDLNGKADVDLSNMSASQSAIDTIVDWGLPDFTGKITLTWGTTYTVPSNGFLYLYGEVTNANEHYLEVYADGYLIYRAKSDGYAQGFSSFVPVSKDTIITYNGTPYANTKVLFYPVKGV